MTTANQGMSVEEIEQIVAQRVANAIEAIAIYETKTSMARESMSQTKRQGDKVAENASNKRKWEVSASRWVTKHEIGGSQFQKQNQGPQWKKQKAEVTCYECGNQGHYRKKCTLLKFLNCVDKYWKEKAREDSSITTSNVNI
ncbi:reverse transcriptase domain-containing protein [Tanacetum coccineum]